MLTRSSGVLLPVSALPGSYGIGGFGVSQMVIVTMQDLLGKSSSARMHRPNTVGDNWKWRMLPDELSLEQECLLARLTHLYARERRD